MNKIVNLSLLDNSHDFMREAINKAVLAETKPIEWKFAIFCLVQSIELILKARLRKEHEILIFQNIDKPKNTIGIDHAINRLTKISSINLSKEDLYILTIAKDWRNLIVHFEFEFQPKELKVAFSKLLGFLKEFNNDQFDILIEEKVEYESWNKAMKILEYTDELYQRAKQLIKDENISEYNIWECRRCSYDAFVIEDDKCYCYVCGHYEPIFKCVNCNETFFEDEIIEFNVTDYAKETICKYCAYEFDKERNYYEY